MKMLEFLFAFLFLVIGWFIYRFKRLESLVRHIPGPATIPILGNGLLFVGKTPEEVLNATRRLSDQYGSFFRVFLGPQLDIVLKDPKDVEALLASQTLIEKAGEYDFMKEWLGTGLLISTGRKWHARRKVITPAFHFQILEQFVDVFDKHSAIFVDNLRQFGEQEVDVFPFITLCALDIICETSMGVEINAQTNSESVYVKAVKAVSSIITIRHYNFLLRSNWLFRLSPYYYRQKKFLKILHGFTDSVIVTRRDELTKKLLDRAKADEPENDDGCKKKMALLDVLLQSTINGKPLSNMDIREEVDTFMFEGHDTTTSGIAFCLYCLAKYPEIQQNTFNEIRNVIGDDVEKETTLKELNDLNYLELVIKETLRIFPSVPFYGRKIRKDFYLSKFYHQELYARNYAFVGFIKQKV